jgi:signal transduction histidine kinase
MGPVIAMRKEWLKPWRGLFGEVAERTTPMRYGVAVLALAVSALLRVALNPFLEHRSPYLTFFLGVLLAAWYGGMGPALFVIVSGSILGHVLFVMPVVPDAAFADPSEFFALVLFVLVGLSTAALSEGQRIAHAEADLRAREATERHRQLQEEVRHRLRVELRLRNVLRELERSNRELQDFAFVASHDLQEPLRKIQAFGSRLASKYRESLPEDGQDYLARVLSASERMQVLIHDLLEFSRVTTKAQPFERVDVGEVLATVLDDLQVRIQNVEGEVRISPMPSLDADRTQMHQLFQNLIGNALKFRREGVAPVVEVEAKERVGERGVVEWVIEVRDNGIGFDDRHTDKIFAIFQRLHGRAEYEGSGIGLAICRRIVERHGGDISARGVPGQGATFAVVLPEVQDSAPDGAIGAKEKGER